MFQILRFKLFALAFLLFPQGAFAQEATLEITEKQEVYILGKNVYVFEDTAAIVSFEQIISPTFQNKFVPSKVNALNYGVTPSVIWVKILLQNQVANSSNQYVISLDYPLFGYVTFFQKNTAGLWTKQETGDRLPYSDRQIINRNFVFSINMPPDSVSTYYMRFHTSGSMQINPILYRKRAFLVANTYAELIYGLFYGGMLIIMFYNLFLFFSLKEKAYLA